MTILSRLRATGPTTGAVRVEDVYDTDLDDLWAACTTPARLARWIATVTGDLRVGGEFHAVFTSTADTTGRIVACEPPHHLLLDTTGTGEGSHIEAWLTAEGPRTRLVVEERGLPLDHLYAYGAGWQAHAEDLGRSLVGEPSVWKQRWDELSDAYRGLPVS